MVKEITLGFALITIIFLFTVSLLENLLVTAYEKESQLYFCSRTDNSYNVAISYSDENILITDKNGTVKLFNLSKTIDNLTQSPSHRILSSVLDKLKNKKRFNFRINTMLQICGTYEEPVGYKEIFAFKGNKDCKDLFEFINCKDIGWKKEIQQDDDLVYIILYLFVKGYFNRYIFFLYKEFILIYNRLLEPIYRLDIDYKKVFGIDIKEQKEDYLFQVIRYQSFVFVARSKEMYKHTDTIIFAPFTNPIAETLSKHQEIDIKRTIAKQDIKKLKEIVDVEKIKSKKKFMELINSVKTDKKIKEMFPTETKQ